MFCIETKVAYTETRVKRANRELKEQLKQYDMRFARRHGRMPVKAEKEPIRPLYEKYNALWSQITNMELEGQDLASLKAEKGRLHQMLRSDSRLERDLLITEGLQTFDLLDLVQIYIHT